MHHHFDQLVCRSRRAERQPSSKGNADIRFNQSLLKTFVVFLFLKQMMTNAFVDTTNTRMAFRSIPIWCGDEREAETERERKRNEKRKSYSFLFLCRSRREFVISVFLSFFSHYWCLILSMLAVRASLSNFWRSINRFDASHCSSLPLTRDKVSVCYQLIAISFRSDALCFVDESAERERESPRKHRYRSVTVSFAIRLKCVTLLRMRIIDIQVLHVSSEFDKGRMETKNNKQLRKSPANGTQIE